MSECWTSQRSQPADIAQGTLRYFLSSHAAAQSALYPPHLEEILDQSQFAAATAEIAQWEGYSPTPLIRLSGLARQIGVGEIFYKDESPRFGLGSFKALGGPYQVLRILQQELSKKLERKVTTTEIRGGSLEALTREFTFVSATDGNHGKAVAWGAAKFGCKSRIFIHAAVSPARQAAIAAFGAEVVRVAGGYDEAVREAARFAANNGGFLASDTSYDGYMDWPKHVMAGYSVLATECLNQLGTRSSLPLTHVFVQAGVGGLAAALCSVFWIHFREHRPCFIVVEPDKAGCLFASAVNRRPTEVAIADETIMAGLSCGEVSRLAWSILATGADGFVTISDDLVAPTMKLLGQRLTGDARVVAGESGVAGLAAVVGLAGCPRLAAASRLDRESRILVIGSEGATDPEIYNRLVGTDVSGRGHHVEGLP